MSDCLQILGSVCCLELFCGDHRIGCIIVIVLVGLGLYGMWLAGLFHSTAISAIKEMNATFGV